LDGALSGVSAEWKADHARGGVFEFGILNSEFGITGQPTPKQVKS
jgi:hypothetical protein